MPTLGAWRCLSATRSSASDEPRRPDNAAESLGTGRHRPDVRLGERHGGMERQRHAGPLFAPHARTVHSRNSSSTSFRPASSGSSSKPSDGIPVGALDFFELDPINRRAGIGILIHDDGTARQRLCRRTPWRPTCRYARDSAEPAPALVQRRFRQRPQPETLRQSGIRRNRRQTRLAMAAGRLRR